MVRTGAASTRRKSAAAGGGGGGGSRSSSGGNRRGRGRSLASAPPDEAEKKSTTTTAATRTRTTRTKRAASASAASRTSRVKKKIGKMDQGDTAEEEDEDVADSSPPEEKTTPSRTKRRRVGSSRSRSTSRATAAAAPASTPTRRGTPTRSSSRNRGAGAAASETKAARKSYSEKEQDDWFEEMLMVGSSDDDDDAAVENESSGGSSEYDDDDDGGATTSRRGKRRGRAAGSSNRKKKKIAAKKRTKKHEAPGSGKKKKVTRRKNTPKKKKKPTPKTKKGGSKETAESSSSPEVQHVCEHCNKSFKGPNGLSYHITNNVCKRGTLSPRAAYTERDKWKGRGGKYGPIEMRTCPYCDKVFSIVSGLAYHLEHRVCRRDDGGVGVTSKAKGKGRGIDNKYKGMRIAREVQNLLGTAPYPQLRRGSRFVTQFGIVEVVADDRIPADYGKTRIGLGGGGSGGGGSGSEDDDEDEEEERLVKEASNEFKRYKTRMDMFKKKNRAAYGRLVRSNLRKRRRLGRHYAKEAGLDNDESPRSSSAAAAASAASAATGNQEPATGTTQMVVWRESVKNAKLTPDAILRHGANYEGYGTRDKAKAEALANSPHVSGVSFQRRGTGIKIEDRAPPPPPSSSSPPPPSSSISASLVEVPKNPLAPDDSYPDRIVTCRLVQDKRKRIYDYDDPAAALKKTGHSSMGKMDSAWDIVLKAQAEVKRAKAEEAEEKSKGKGRKKKKKKTEDADETEEKKDESGQAIDAEATGDDEEYDIHNPPVISKLCLRRCLLTVPYERSLPVFICRECGKTFSSRVGLKDHVVNRTCLPPETESESEKDEDAEEEEDASDTAATPKVLEGSGIKLRRQRSRKRKTYVEVGSDDDEQADEKDDEEWDAAANADVNNEDDDVISVVSEKEDEPPIAAEELEDDPDVLVVDAVPASSSKKTPARKKRRISAGASVSTARSKGRQGQSTKHFRETALDGFDPDGDDSSVEILRSRKTPVKKRFGIDPNRSLSRREWQRLKRPGWMLFKPEVSCWYPEIMKTLGIKRGSNNSNWRRLTVNQKRFEPARKQRNERKAKAKLGNSPVYLEVLSHLNLLKGVALKGMYINVFESLGFKKARRNASIRPNRRNRDCPALCICGDEDQNYERKDQYLERLVKQEQREREAAERERDKAEGKPKKRKRQKRKRPKRANPAPPITTTDPSSKDFSVHAFRIPQGPMIDLNVLVEEVDAGRFPSMKRYTDDHIDVCEICMEDNADDEDEDQEGDGRGPIYGCAFCSNAEHLSCLLSKYNVHDWDEHDDFMCHSCLATCLHRRHRAERRRLAKGANDLSAEGANESIIDAHSTHEDGTFAGMDLDDDDIGAAALDGGDDADDLGMPPLVVPEDTAMIKGDAAEEVTHQAANGFARANATSTAAAASSQTAFGADAVDLSHAERQTHSKCPEGGPGGLICCQHCASSYSRILSSTTKEMEAQTVSKVGKEVGELMELLMDAQTRLRLAVDVSRENDIRRRTLDM